MRLVVDVVGVLTGHRTSTLLTTSSAVFTVVDDVGVTVCRVSINLAVKRRRRKLVNRKTFLMFSPRNSVLVMVIEFLIK